jgi:hypothetical protein
VVLGASVLQHLLGLAGAAQRVQRPLSRRDRLARQRGEACGGLGHHLRTTRDRPGLRRSAELLDAPLDLARVSLRLAQMLLKALLVGRLRRHGNVSLECCLELLLLAVRLVQVLDQLRVPGVGVRHRSGCLLEGVTLFAYPVDMTRNLNRSG